jgi:hypothetical protein
MWPLWLHYIFLHRFSVQFLFALSHKWQEFQNKINEHKMCIVIFSINFARNISHSNNNSARHYHKRKGTVLLVTFLTDFLNIPKYQIS